MLFPPLDFADAQITSPSLLLVLPKTVQIFVSKFFTVLVIKSLRNSDFCLVPRWSLCCLDLLRLCETHIATLFV